MHYQRNKKILLYIFLFLLIGTLNNKNFNKINFLKIEKISVIGLGDQNKNDLINNLNFLEFNNLFFVNKSKITEIINSNSLVEKYSVFKKYPSSLIIKIIETKFLAQIKKENKNFFLGSNGKLTSNIELKSNLPFIFGNFENKSFFDLKKAIDETNFDYNEIKNLFFFKSGRWDIELNNGLLIKLPKDEIKKSLDLLISFLNTETNTKIKEIDLRQSNQIIING